MSLYIFAAVLALVFTALGRRAGVAAERLRSTIIFDAALCVVTSGALSKVRRCIRNETSIDEMREELRREADARLRERDFHRRFGV